jgi:hypothetical protein
VRPLWRTTFGLLTLTAIVAVFLAVNLEIERQMRIHRYRRDAAYWAWERQRFQELANDETVDGQEHWAAMARWAELQFRRKQRAADRPWDLVPPAPPMPRP